MRKVYYVYVLLSSTILGAGNAMAECVATPDCEELGYTETSCAEGGVKCPWDTTKLFCGPSCSLTTTKAECDANCQNVGAQSCSKNGVTYYAGCGTSKCTSGQSCVNGSCTCDSIYQYACSGTGYSSGSGTACGGKYTSCNCATNYVWSNGACSCNGTFKYACSGTGYASGVGTSCGGKYASCNCSSGYNWDGSSCAQSCVVGSILNSDMSCSAAKVSGKTPIGVVSYVNGSTRLAINLTSPGTMYWSSSYVDISGITNYTSSSTALNDFSGKSNTAAAVASNSSTSYAPGYCYNFTTTGTSKGQWYLPAAGELYASIWTNKTAVNSGLSAAGRTAIETNDYHWSSSEYTNNNAWNVNASSGNVNNNNKNNNNYVRCVLAFGNKMMKG